MSAEAFWREKADKHFKTAEVLLEALREDEQGRTSATTERQAIRAARAKAHAQLAAVAAMRELSP